MLIKDLVAMIAKYNTIKERADQLRAKLRAFDPAYDSKDDLDKEQAAQATAIDTTGWNIDSALNSKGIRDNKTAMLDLLLKLEKIINEMDTDTLTKI